MDFYRTEEKHKQINRTADQNREESMTDLLKGLNPVQREAVLYTGGPLLILAGAGSGKTKVITHRIAYLVHTLHVLPGEIMAITFTNKAAAEMKERTETLLGFQSRAMWIGTFHSMMLRILRQHAARIGFAPNFTILDVDDQYRLLKRIMKDLNVNENLVSVTTVHNQISDAKNKMIEWQDYLKTVQTKNRDFQNNRMLEETAEIYEAYQKRMQQANSMDFDDILLYAVKLLRDNSDVLEAYQDRFKHILVDEYQDTNHVQYLLVKLLSQKHRNLCVVGDDDQSIYGFRGANIENILDFEKDFKNSKVIKLEQNYRSTGTILGAANSLIGHNQGRKDKKLWTDHAQGEPIQFYRAETHYDEARYVVSEIERLTCRIKDPLPAGNIGILYRANALSRNLEFAFREKGIKYNIYGGLRFYDRKEIRDFLAYMRVIFSENDELALTRIINVPKRGIGSVSLDLIRNLAGRQGVPMMRIIAQADQYPELSRAAAKLNEFTQIIAQLRQIILDNELSFPEFCRAIMIQSGILADLSDQQKKGEQDALSRIQNLEEIISDAIEFTEKRKQEIEQFRQMEDVAAEAEYSPLTEDTLYDEDLSLVSLTKGFLEQSILYSDLDQDDADNTVRMMTIHSAKGLEFDAVFLVGAEESIFPSYQSENDPALLEEERRLAYVAITRAKKYLHITATRSRLLYGQTRYNPVSCFVREIPDEYIREIGAARSRPSSPAKASIFSSVSHLTEQKAQAKSYEQSDLDVAKLRVGQVLKHKKFGVGTLCRIDPVANDAILSIDFNGLLKRVIASSALLSLTDD